MSLTVAIYFGCARIYAWMREAIKRIKQRLGEFISCAISFAGHSSDLTEPHTGECTFGTKLYLKQKECENKNRVLKQIYLAIYDKTK